MPEFDTARDPGRPARPERSDMGAPGRGRRRSWPARWVVLGAVVSMLGAAVVATIASDPPAPVETRPGENAGSDEDARVDADEMIATSPSNSMPMQEPIAVSFPDLERVEVNSTPEWTHWSIEVPPELADLAVPTEVVLLTTGVLHRVEFPSGDVSSIALVEHWDPGAAIAVIGDAIAISTYRDVLMIRPGLPVTRTHVGQGVDSIVARPSRGDFVVVPRQVGVYPPAWFIVSVGGVAADLADRIQEVVPTPEQHVVPAGGLIGDAPGGLYAFDDAGAATRIDDGDLVAGGLHHYVVHRCDEEMQCAYHVVDGRTGESREAALGALARRNRLPVFDVSEGVSPNGVYVSFIDWRGNPAAWNIVDTFTGRTIDMGPVTSGPVEGAWAADSSGVFVADPSGLSFVGVGGTAVAMPEFGAIRAVEAQRAPED
ncbi:MAG: hypothetical protein WBP59_10235 [Ilumatobacteraceae bacterium]